MQLLGTKPLGFACSCSRERVEAMLVSLGQAEADAAVEAAGGQAQVRCEFCGQSYRFSPDEIASLFATATADLAAPERLQ